LTNGKILAHRNNGREAIKSKGVSKHSSSFKSIIEPRIVSNQGKCQARVEVNFTDEVGGLSLGVASLGDFQAASGKRGSMWSAATPTNTSGHML
jgi:hypothetical protein